jgi:hypothetical protein
MPDVKSNDAELDAVCVDINVIAEDDVGAFQVPSPRRNVVLFAVPDPKRAVGTDPVEITLASNDPIIPLVSLVSAILSTSYELRFLLY